MRLFQLALALDEALATDPPVSEKQARAMHAAAEGESTLGIPKKVGEEFVGKADDMNPRDWRGVLRFFAEEAEEDEHANDDGNEAAAAELPKPHKKQKNEHVSFTASGTGQTQVPVAPDEGMAAGILFVDPEGKMLLVKRAARADGHAGEWSIPAGMIEKGETAEQAARREAKEEVDFDASGPLVKIDRRVTGDVDFTTYMQRIGQQFAPVLNPEASEFVWADLENLPVPLHAGLVSTLGAHDNGPPKLTGSIAREIRKGLDPNTINRVDVKGGDAWDAIAEDESLGLDRAPENRVYDKFGRMHVAKNNISKGNICPYVGKEIPRYEELGLDPDKVYLLFRDPEELKKAVSTFNNLPVLSEHVPVSAGAHRPDLVIGSTGTDAAWEDPYLTNSIVLWDEEPIGDVESEKKRQLSSAYSYDAHMTPGVYAGQRFDGRMTNIVGNHVALVKEGRVGADVVVGDSREGLDMAKMTNLGSFVLGTLAAKLPRLLAMDITLDPAPLKELTAQNWAKQLPVVKKSLTEQLKGKLAQDASLDDITEFLDTINGPKEGGGGDLEPNSALPIKMEEPDEVDMKDQGGVHELVRAQLAGKLPPEEIDALCAAIEAHEGAGDEDLDDEEKKKKVGEDEPPPFKGKPEVGKGPPDTAAKDEEKKPMDKAAMDAAIKLAVDTATKTTVETATKNAIKLAQDIREAERVVRPWVGDMNVAFDSVPAVYKTALEMMKVPGLDKIHPDAYRPILESQPKPGEKRNGNNLLATDSAVPDAKGFNERFPQATNIKRAT